MSLLEIVSRLRNAVGLTRNMASFRVPKTSLQVLRFVEMSGIEIVKKIHYKRFNHRCTIVWITQRNQEKELVFRFTIGFRKTKINIDYFTCPIVNADFNRPFLSSTTGVGSALYQRSNNGMELSIVYTSKKLNDAQNNNSFWDTKSVSSG